MRHAPRALVSRYARALFAAALERNALDAVRADLAALGAAMRDYPELPLLLENPRLSREKVRGILNALAGRIGAGPLTHRFLDLLVEKDRLQILADLDAQFEALWRTHHGEVEVRVTTAVSISDDTRRTVTDHLARRSGRKPQVVWNTDPALLGGIVIHWPDHVFDGSLARKLQNLKEHLARGA